MMKSLIKQTTSSFMWGQLSVNLTDHLLSDLKSLPSFIFQDHMCLGWNHPRLPDCDCERNHTRRKGGGGGMGSPVSVATLPKRGVAGFHCCWWLLHRQRPYSISHDGWARAKREWCCVGPFSLAHSPLKPYPERVKTDHCASGEFIPSTRGEVTRWLRHVGHVLTTAAKLKKMNK